MSAVNTIGATPARPIIRLVRIARVQCRCCATVRRVPAGTAYICCGWTVMPLDVI